ncbi:peptidase T [Otoolea muris]|uniref:peptidase T n=1 Tax=Otoolea muris TaxID=2941515 RepID=UPI00203ECAE8|nr:peptidase T [Otoolea muris]
MSDVTERFLRYVSFDTQSEESSMSTPSTDRQLDLARALLRELRDMGASNARMDEYGYVYAAIPANRPELEKAPALGFIAHMDTAPAMSGRHVKPRIVEAYDGGDIVLNRELGITMRRADFPCLGECVGQDLIVTDGTTLLGADDKAGIAEIMAMAARLLSNPGIPRGPVCIAFTPDEEIGRGADHFDVTGFGAAAAYTVDGGPIGELEYENFNAASGAVSIKGVSIHPGDAKGRMKNAILLGMEFQSLLPAAEAPMYTEGYEGFFHLDHFTGDVENARMEYIIRDHDRERFEGRKRLFQAAASYLNTKYGGGTLEASVKDSYYNMKEQIKPHMYLIEMASEAMKDAGIEPRVVPIRGGTDGARLSYMGLPCPNLSTGGYHYHGKFEYIPAQSMEKMTDVLVGIVKRAAAVQAV